MNQRRSFRPSTKRKNITSRLVSPCRRKATSLRQSLRQQPPPQRLGIKYVGEFLSKHPSRGPAEGHDPRTEFSGYSAPDLDVKFLLSLIDSHHAVARNACVPDFVMCAQRDPLTVTFHGKKHGCPGTPVLHVRGGVLVTDVLGKRPTLWIPPDLEAQVMGCGKRFAVCNFGLYAGRGMWTGHANALIFDTHAKKIERFEPGGRVEDRVDPFLAKRFAQALPRWSYLGTKHSSSRHGTQTLADSFDGMCVTFSMLYVLLRLLNPNAPSREILEHVETLARKGRLRTDVLRLNKYMSDTLRRYRAHSLSRLKR